MTAIRQLGYLGLEVSDLASWERFAVGVLGLEPAHRAEDGSLALRMDDRAQRIVLHPGPADDLAYLGFELASESFGVCVIDLAVRYQPELGDPRSYRFRSWHRRPRDERLDGHPQILVVLSHLPCPQISRSECLPLQPSAIGTARSPASSASPLRRRCLN